MPQGPNYGPQGGSIWVVGASGTLDLSAAGSLSLPSGGVSSGSFNTGTFSSLRATDGTFPGTIVLGGTAGRWAFGSDVLTNGTSITYTGLSQIVSVALTPFKTAPGTATTSPSSYQVDPARFANGTFFALALQGTFNYAGGGTFFWQAFGF